MRNSEGGVGLMWGKASVCRCLWRLVVEKQLHEELFTQVMLHHFIGHEKERKAAAMQTRAEGNGTCQRRRTYRGGDPGITTEQRRFLTGSSVLVPPRRSGQPAGIRLEILAWTAGLHIYEHRGTGSRLEHATRDGACYRRGSSGRGT